MSPEDVCEVCGAERMEDGLCRNGHDMPELKSNLDQILEGLGSEAQEFLAQLPPELRRQIEWELDAIARPVEGGYEVKIDMDDNGLMLLANLRAIVRDTIKTSEFTAMTPIGEITATPDSGAVEIALKTLMAAVFAEGGDVAIEDVEGYIEHSVSRGIANKILDELNKRGDEKDGQDGWKNGV